MLKVQVTGANKVSKNIFKILGKKIRGYSTHTFDESKRITPYQSGRARKAWRMEKRGKFNIEVVNRVPYAARLDRGYSSQAPRGIIKPASRKVAKKYR